MYLECEELEKYFKLCNYTKKISVDKWHSTNYLKAIDCFHCLIYHHFDLNK